MQLHRRAYDLHLHQLSDEALVVLAKECGYQPAETALLLRYREWSDRLIAQLAHRRGLSAADTEDAKQDAVFGILKGIARYDTLQLGRLKGCMFRTFLGRVLGDRFKDFVKHLWRVRNRFGRSLDALNGDGAETATQPYSAAARALVCHDLENDPAHAVASNELMARFRSMVEQLGETERALLEKLMSGMRLRGAAAHVGISYDKAKRRWRQLRVTLAAQLATP
jgi:DNA-directed RNA polymerase specialized sigma24 family protein